MDNRVIKEGFLVKKGHIRHNWKSRWFKLSKVSLRYYKDNYSKVPKGRIALDEVSLSTPNCIKGRKFRFKLVTNEGVEYCMQALCEKDYIEWIEAIGKIIGIKQQICWKMKRITQQSQHISYILVDLTVKFLKKDGMENDVFDIENMPPDIAELKRISRIIKGVYYTAGFTGTQLKMWMKKNLNIQEYEAEVIVSGLLRNGLIQEQTNNDKNPFDEETYYKMLIDEEHLKLSCSSSLKSPSTNSSPRSESQLSCANQELVLPCDIPRGKVVKSGILVKQGHIAKTWKVRGFALQSDPSTLSYFDISKKNNKIIRTLDITGARVVLAPPSNESGSPSTNPPKKFCLKLRNEDMYIMYSYDSVDTKEWMESIAQLC